MKGKFFKRSVSLCVGLAVMSSTPAFGASAHFKDVTTKYDWAAEAIDGLYDSGVVTGFKDGYFRPADAIKRSDFMIMLYKMFSEEGADYNGALAPDVEEGIYYENAIRWASAIRMINPVVEFYPDEAIKREDAFYFIYKCLETTGVVNDTNRSSEIEKFHDAADVSEDKAEAVATLIKLGIVSGYNGLVAPKMTMTRAEMAVVFMNAEKAVDSVVNRGGIETDASVGFGVSSADSKLTISTNANTNYLLDGTEAALKGETVSVEENGKSGIVLQNGARLDIEDFNIKKNGDSTSSVNTGISGVNSAVVVRNGSTLNMKNTDIRTGGKYSNGISIYDGGNTVNIEGGTIRTREEHSLPVMINDNSYLSLKNTKIDSIGENLTGVSIIGAGGRAEISDCEITSYGKGSRGISTGGDLNIKDSVIKTDESYGIEALGNTAVTIDNAEFSTASSPIRLSTKKIEASDGTKKNTTRIVNTRFPDMGSLPLIDIVNVHSDLYIAESVFSSPLLIKTHIDKSVNSGAQGADAEVTFDHQEAVGDIRADRDTAINIVLKNSSYLKTSLNDTKSAGRIDVVFQSADDKLELTGDSYIGIIQNNEDTTFQSIIDNGKTLYYDASLYENDWLYDRTWVLPGGGLLVPYND